jgi:hypothetical protein
MNRLIAGGAQHRAPKAIYDKRIAHRGAPLSRPAKGRFEHASLSAQSPITPNPFNATKTA